MTLQQIDIDIVYDVQPGVLSVLFRVRPSSSLKSPAKWPVTSKTGRGELHHLWFNSVRPSVQLECRARTTSELGLYRAINTEICPVHMFISEVKMQLSEWYYPINVYIETEVRLTVQISEGDWAMFPLVSPGSHSAPALCSAQWWEILRRKS